MYGQFSHPRNKLADVQVFYPNSTASNVGWQTWTKRPGATMVSIFCVGGGGSGGNGVVGAASTAAGGGGGGSSSQSYVECPAIMLPETLFVAVGVGGIAPVGTGQISRVCINPSSVAGDTLVIANAGVGGGSASGATAGAAGAAGAIATIGTMPLSGAGTSQLIAGMAGIIGGTTVSGGALTLPAGLRVTGGTGGGGLPAGGVAGTAGGAFALGGALAFPAQIGGIGGAAATTPPTGGSNGYAAIPPFVFFYGGTGGGSTHGTATGAGLVGAPGGAGGYGSGGGGGGGALTGSTAANLGGRGGDGLVIIVQW